ncbi:radical SAM protein [Paenibacillus rhizoplanae]|uniref:radical SAM protein n=1 Tax=Paenibacillus rhizoplanae TaxID=1917181 RepID=UPI003606B892
MRQPQTSVVLDRDSFERLKKTIKHMSVTHKQVHLNPAYSTNLPVEVGLKLTNGCNLRCKHCFEWNAEGYHRDLGRAEQREELDFAVIEKVFRQTKETNANMFLWGGEPLYYSRFNELADLLEQDPRWTVLCTNGIQIIEKLDSILKMSKSLVCLISLEGFEAENDAIRGKGTFKKVMAGIDKLLELEKEGIYQGKISIHLTISDVMIDKLYDFVEFLRIRELTRCILLSRGICRMRYRIIWTAISTSISSGWRMTWRKGTATAGIRLNIKFRQTGSIRCLRRWRRLTSEPGT